MSISAHPNGQPCDSVIREIGATFSARLDAHEARHAERAAALERRIDNRLSEVVAEVQALATSVGGLERARLVEEAREAGRREALGEPEITSPGARSPLDGPSDRLARWVSRWSPWHVIVAIGLVIGGPTVAGPAVSRVLDAVLPDAHPAPASPPASPHDLGDCGTSDTGGDHVD